MVTKIQKWGNSQGLRFPKAILEEMQIQIGDEVEIRVEGGQIIVKPIHKIRGKYRLEALVSQLSDTYEAEEVEWGKQEGKEAW